MERLGSGDELVHKRYDRHIRLAEIGIEGQKKLQSASVLIVGVGGLGSPIALYLAAAGVGRIGLIDADTVSMSNLQRQVLYSEEEIGMPKVVCAKNRLLKLNSNLIIETYPFRLDKNNADELIAKYDIVVDGCDNFTTRYLIDDVTSKSHKPYVYGSIGEFQGQVAVFNNPEGGSYRNLFPCQSESLNKEPTIAGVMGVVPGVIGTFQASEVIKLITGAGELLHNRLLTIDLLTMNVQVLKL